MFSGNRIIKFNFFFHDATALVDLGLLSVEVSRSHTFRHTTLSRTPLDEWSAHRRGTYLTTCDDRKRQTSITPTKFQPALPANERPLTYAIDRAAIAIGLLGYGRGKLCVICWRFQRSFLEELGKFKRLRCKERLWIDLPVSSFYL